MHKVIEVQGLHKVYKSIVAVDDMSFHMGLLGPNGASKTTTVECLQGLRHADGGKVRILGLDPWTQRTSLRKRISGQLQESAYRIARKRNGAQLSLKRHAESERQHAH